MSLNLRIEFAQKFVLKFAEHVLELLPNGWTGAPFQPEKIPKGEAQKPRLDECGIVRRPRVREFHGLIGRLIHDRVFLQEALNREQHLT